MWRAHFACSMTDLSVKPCQDDSVVWMQPALKPDGTKYYEGVLIHVMTFLLYHTEQALFWRIFLNTR